MHVDALRPISVECMLLRMAGSAIARRAEVREWTWMWASRSMHDGIGDRGIEGEILSLESAVPCGMLVSLD